MKKWMLIVIIAILFVATILLAIFFNTPKVVATDTVDMEYFNKIIEQLNATITNMQTDIDTLEASNAKLQTEIEVLNSKINNQQKQVNNNSILINKSIIRIDKIEKREDKLYNTFRMNSYTQHLSGIMNNFKNSQ